MTENNKSIYAEWAASYPKLPLFFYPWWLDAVCGPGRWEVAVAQNANGQVEGVWPYYAYRRYGQAMMGMPMLTPYLGPLLVYPHKVSRPQRRSFEKKTMDALIDQLPDFFYAYQTFTPRIDNWLPFYWRGFRQTTYYTYILKDINETEKVFRRFRSKTRNHIRVAARGHAIEKNGSLSDFFTLNKMAFEGQNMPYSYDVLKKIDDQLQPRGWRKIYLARSEDGLLQGGVYVVQDQHSAYLLASGRRPGSDSGVAPMLIWQAIQDLAEEVRQFDFEGSVIPGIETFFRSFGGSLTPYYQVSRGKYRWVEWLKMMKEKRYPKK